MDGYRQSSFDPDAGSHTDTAPKGSWWKIILWSLAYMIPLFWMWDRTDFPDSFGVHITAHGRVGLAESWYYSYLLLERHHVLDVITFMYMWSIVIGFIAWIAAKQLRNANWSFYSDAKRASDRDVKIIDSPENRWAFPSFTPSEWALLCVLLAVLLSGLGWALNFQPKQFSGMFTSENAVRAHCFNEKGSYPDSDVTSACKQLIEDSTVAIDARRDDANAYFNRGFAYEHAGDLNHAIADFSQVIRLSPDSSQAYYYRWAAYIDSGDAQRASADFANLRRLDPGFAAEIRDNH